MQANRSKVFIIKAKSPILNVCLSSEYGYATYKTTDF